MDLYLFSSVLGCCVLAGICYGQDTMVSCPDSWEPFNGNCYLFVTNKLVTYSQTTDECNKFDSSPMYFDTQDEINWFKKMIQKYPSSEYWTALNDIPRLGGVKAPGTGQWKWGLYGRVDPSLIRWTPVPANDTLNNCGGLNALATMEDADCNSRQGYICNIELTAGAKCPTNWIATDTDCYYISNASDPAQRFTWSNAKDRCSALIAGAHLITIDDVNDQSFLVLVSYSVTDAFLRWTGLQYQNGAWGWFNGATFSQQFFKWATEPDDVANIENCAVIRPNGMFSDRACNMVRNFMCKTSQTTIDTTFNLGCGTWTRAGSSCYKFFKNPLSTWDDAQATCKALKGNLINVKDKDLKMWLTNQMLDPMNNWPMWTALNDKVIEGSFVWSDGSALDPDTIAWNQEPNDYKGNEDCATVMPDGNFNDNPCTAFAAPLCEVDNVSACPTRSDGGYWLTRNSDSGSGFDCYLFGNTSTYDALMTYAEARDYCPTLASTTNQIPALFVLDSAAERSFITEQLHGYLKDPFTGFWTQLTDAGSEGYWSWAGNKQADTGLVTWVKEPLSLTPDMDCVQVIYNSYFVVRKCGTKSGYICERSAYSPGRSAGTKLSGNLVLSAIAGIYWYMLIH
ncbi:macrophage mannose receptor 1-like [Dreissena polymorpha]|uniref:C-type lectin domain-containing protein n=1 Tax=Dreissena polymorpha TaxID=45954 RepID=A0A9D4NBP5_DREPO|nr:macrophage mannose receptor 1-like [Dreissena polymorpha]KAH3891696.1 hypothetical protein DPMN_015801 [Dreissena polymorpha]